MTKTPVTLQSGKLAVEALNVMKQKKVSCLPVLSGEKVVGTLRLQDIINVGIVG